MRPIPIIAICPQCQLQHIDRDEWATEAKAHRKHLCEGCGHVWLCFATPTVGVQRQPRLSYVEFLMCRRLGLSSDEAHSVNEAAPRAIIVGEAPGPNTFNDCPMYPYPERSAGGRLLKMSGMKPLDYLRAFHRVNLNVEYSKHWGAPQQEEARHTAGLLGPVAENLALPLVLLGVRVARAFGLEHAEQLQWMRFNGEPGNAARTWLPEKAVDTGLRAVRLPHPSGRNHVYNNPATVGRAGARLVEAAGVGL